MLFAKLKSYRRPQSARQMRFALPNWSFRLSRLAARRAA
jgi:hypothetical protein